VASSTKPIGLDRALSTLRQIDPVLVREAQKRLRNEAKPMASEAKAAIPTSPPLSRWVPSSKSFADNTALRQGSSRLPVWSSPSAKRKIGIMVRRQKMKGYTGRRALVALRQNDAAGAVFDIAGTGNTFGRNLEAKFGSRSRYMWPAAEKHRDTVQQSINRAKFDMEEVINEALRGKGYHPTSARLIVSGRAPLGGRV